MGMCRIRLNLVQSKLPSRPLARTYAIRAKEEAMKPDAIAGTFNLFDVTVIALIDPGSTHSYICTTFALEKKIPVASIEFYVRVSNPIGQTVVVNKVCKICPLKIWGYEFSADLMLLPFDEFSGN
ncbi:TBC1 domain family member 1 [Gossypium australe]|uniref:TBC1 domain family member 1 n=1 Tax=Gossypium australe TaxID=47621 RepID=A0A5B6VB44_9ROSI|nr:TBC1 domain family member 1 [Gossypium australe]